jgi:hypothetical protein
MSALTKKGAARYLSEPLASMLSLAGLQIGEVDDAIAQQIARGLPPLLRPGHPHLSKISDATGLNVVSVGRRYHRLLIEVGEKSQKDVWWIYREHNRTSAEFLCGSVIPITAATALVGEPLSSLADLPFKISTASIHSVDIIEGSWLRAAVVPEWIDL